MKTQILTIAAVITLALSTSKTTYASVIKDNASTELADVKHINKIELRGNVELYVSNGSEENVKVYNRYYTESALVQNQNGTLRISSYKNEKLVVWVTAADLRNITAYDNAIVKSFGNLTGIELEVNLYNHASADLNMDAYSANINVNDFATANLAGNVTDCNLKYNQAASVNSTKFTADKMVRTVNNDTFAKAEQLTGL